jgi:hypothetical protein
LALLDPTNGTKSVKFSVERHSAERIEFAHEGESDRVIDQVIAADPAAMEGQQVAMKCSDDGDDIYAVLHGIRIARRLPLNLVRSVGSRFVRRCHHHFSSFGLPIWYDNPPAVHLVNDWTLKSIDLKG